MVMNTNPRDEPHPYVDSDAWQRGYFSECMSGFEHQVAAHMMAEGMVDEALLLTRAIHDRYHAAKRNPYNEIEASDHYARAMASYGTFVSACGFRYHGPEGMIAFAPRWNRHDFRAPFTTAEGWGTYRQRVGAGRQQHQLALKYGSLRLARLEFAAEGDRPFASVNARLDDRPVPARVERLGDRACVTLQAPVRIATDQVLSIEL